MKSVPVIFTLSPIGAPPVTGPQCGSIFTAVGLRMDMLNACSSGSNLCQSSGVLAMAAVLISSSIFVELGLESDFSFFKGSQIMETNLACAAALRM
jgi:hypothetical protein